MKRMYVPAMQVLRPRYLLDTRSTTPLPFPLDHSNSFYFYVARSGIYQLFRALGVSARDIVLAPAYHSGNETKAIRAAGATLQYYSIGRNFELDVDEVSTLVSRSGVRALLLIHYLGWPQPLEPLLTRCRERNVLVVEDCALSFLSTLGGKALGSLGSYGIFCLYKTLPVPNGGMLVANGAPLPGLLGLTLRAPDRLSSTTRMVELLIEWLRSRIEPVGAGLQSLKGIIGDSLNATRVARVPVGDMGFNVENVDISMSRLARQLLLHFAYQDIVRKRRENFGLLRDRLKGTIPIARDTLKEGVCPLFFPILVRSKGDACRALRSRGIQAVEFWNSGDVEATESEFPDAQYLRDHVLELPIHQDITSRHIEYMAETVAKLDLGVA